MSSTSEDIGHLSPLKRAFLALEDMQSKLDTVERLRTEPIAIIGIGCRFPGGANNPEAFWRLLRDGVDAISEVPAERWDVNAFYDPDPTIPGKISTRWGGFLEYVDQFDASFFGISPREAVSMDPQQRLLLEVAYEGLEDAGQRLDRLAGSRTGVFIGICSSDYSWFQLADPDRIDAYTSSGWAHSVASGRLSYLLDLQGPSVAIDTACSSSLVAVHLACQSLRNQECHLALAGGVNLILSPLLTISFSKFGMMAADGRCKTFDARANGFVRGEGCGVVVLKRLSNALADGDNILALIRGSATNQDGRSNGLTAPNVLSQQAVIRQALDNAGVAPSQVTYIEAHGTGTSLGDPIEVEALTDVYGQPSTERRPCAIGSVKTNIGHLEAASGIAGLIKGVLALQHETIPPHLNFQRLNPNISLENTPFVIPTACLPWSSATEQRIAGVSSFGFSGTNAHVILEAASQGLVTPQPVEETATSRALLLPLSARSAEALRALAGSHRDLFAAKASDAEKSLQNVCYTASVRRTHHDYRLAIVGRSREELSQRLETFMRGESRPGIVSGHLAAGRQPRLVFVFSGQGPQWAGMGQSLFEQEPVFRSTLEQCDELLRRHADWSLLGELFADASTSRLDQTAIAQPAIFAVQVGLAALWRSWGIHPDAVVGHSVGEVAAAHVAGVLSLEDAVRVIFHRGRLMQGATGRGKMAAVELPEKEIEQVLSGYKGQLSLAAMNSPTATVISGDETALGEVLQALKSQKVVCRLLAGHYAFHSHQMTLFQSDLESLLAAIQRQPAACSLYSTVSGALSQGQDFDAAYWGRNIREPVRFAAAIDRMAEAGHDVFLELGPHPVLLRAITECLGARGQAGTVLASLRRSREGRVTMLEALGALYTVGYPVEWGKLYPSGGQCVRLPTYPWQRQRYWLEAPKDAVRKRRVLPHNSAPDTTSHPLLDQRLCSPSLQDIVFESQLSSHFLPFLADHRVYGTIVFPATGYVEMVLAAAAQTFSTNRCILQDTIIREPLLFQEDDVRLVQVILTPEKAGVSSFQVVSLDSGDGHDQALWRRHVTGQIHLVQTETGTVAPEFGHESFQATQSRCREQLPVDPYYQQLYTDGLQYGPSFRCIEQLWQGDREALGRIKLPDRLMSEASHYQMHPVLLDACLQICMAAWSASNEWTDAATLYLPLGIEHLQIFERSGAELWSHAMMRPGNQTNQETMVGDLHLWDAAGQPVAAIEGLTLKRAQRESLQRTMQKRNDDVLYEVVWQPREREVSTDSVGQQPIQQGSWMIFADNDGIGVALARLFEEHGESCMLVFPGEVYEQFQAGHWRINPGQPADFSRFLSEAMVSKRPGCKGVIHLWRLETLPGDVPTVASLQSEQALGCGSALHLVQALATAEGASPPGLWLVTRGAQAVGTSPAPLSVAQSPLWGLGRVIALEHPELHCVRVDLDPAEEQEPVRALFEEIWQREAAEREDQVAFRRGVRYVPRLVRMSSERHVDTSPASVSSVTPVQLAIAARGIIDNLSLQPMSRRSPTPGEVEIAVHSTGLNFRDVLNVLGMYPGEAGPLGLECAGTVVAVGQGVEAFQVGDAVLALAPGSFRTFVTVAANGVVRKPEAVSFEAAATIPVAFLTAFYALHSLAKMSAGERVLIHAAAGGVGMAAVRLAQRAGAEIYATAGSPQKRAFLESLGIEHVMDSRSLDFAEAVMTRTGGAGVDIVLNSLAGEFIPKSLSVLGASGRFVEIGKRDIWDEHQVARVRSDVSYWAFDLGTVSQQEPALIQSLLSELVEAFEEGTLSPLPHRVFPIEEAASAFRYMAQARHIGKIVVSQPAVQAAVPSLPGADSIREDGTYLITGGLGGLGLCVARWLVEGGARHLVLMGRSAASKSARAAIAELEQIGARVLVVQGDIAQESDVARVLVRIAREFPALRGIVHAAGVLDDGMLLQQAWSRFATVMAPKVAGAWNLHVLTQDLPLDFFVLFSSMAALLGSPGQGNYAAANAFLDGLAHYRRAQGLPGLSINWGPWSAVGMAHALGRREQQRWVEMGVGMLTVEQGLEALERVLRQGAVQVGVLPVTWSRFVSRFASGRAVSFLAEVACEGQGQMEPAVAQHSALLRQLEAAPPTERRELLVAYLQEQISQVLGFDSSHLIGSQQGFWDMGIDSLMAVELQNRLQIGLESVLPSTLVFDYPTIEELAEYLEREFFSLASPSAKSHVDSRQVNDERVAVLTELEPLSEDEMIALLADELATIDKKKSRETT